MVHRPPGVFVMEHSARPAAKQDCEGAGRRRDGAPAYLAGGGAAGRGGGGGGGGGQRPYIRRQCTPIRCLRDAYLGTPYPSY